MYKIDWFYMSEMLTSFSSILEGCKQNDLIKLNHISVLLKCLAAITAHDAVLESNTIKLKLNNKNMDHNVLLTLMTTPLSSRLCFLAVMTK